MNCKSQRNILAALVLACATIVLFLVIFKKEQKIDEEEIKEGFRFGKNMKRASCLRGNLGDCCEIYESKGYGPFKECKDRMYNCRKKHGVGRVCQNAALKDRFADL